MLFIGKRLISDIPKINIYVSVELKWATLTEPQFRPSSLGFRRWFVPFYWRDLQTKHWERCRVLRVLYCQQNNILRGVVTNGFFPLLEEENVLKRKGKKILCVCVCVFWCSCLLWIHTNGMSPVNDISQGVFLSVFFKVVCIVFLIIVFMVLNVSVGWSLGLDTNFSFLFI